MQRFEVRLWKSALSSDGRRALRQDGKGHFPLIAARLGAPRVPKRRRMIAPARLIKPSRSFEVAGACFIFDHLYNLYEQRFAAVAIHTRLDNPLHQIGQHPYPIHHDQEPESPTPRGGLLVPCILQPCSCLPSMAMGNKG